MLKALDSMKSVQRRAAGVLRQLLEQVPVIDVLDIEHQMQKSDHGIDLLARVKVSGRQHALVCGVGGEWPATPCARGTAAASRLRGESG